jgi:hypothetical protein
MKFKLPLLLLFSLNSVIGYCQQFDQEVYLNNLQAQSTNGFPNGLHLTSSNTFQNNQAVGVVGLHRRFYMSTSPTGNDKTDQVGIWIKGFYQNSDQGLPIMLGGYGYSSEQAFMIIKQTGNVGIGTNNPTYKLAVEGTIGARKMKVTQEAWPDYVFAAEYKLPSLKEVEDYIIINKHLPDVPSAQEIKQSGLDLGEMNKILLQKLEEQTLYLIEMEKKSEERYKQQQLLIDQLAKELKDLQGEKK